MQSVYVVVLHTLTPLFNFYASAGSAPCFVDENALFRRRMQIFYAKYWGAVRATSEKHGRRYDVRRENQSK